MQKYQNLHSIVLSVAAAKLVARRLKMTGCQYEKEAENPLQISSDFFVWSKSAVISE